MISWITSSQLTKRHQKRRLSEYIRYYHEDRTISDSGREHQTEELAPQPQVTSSLMCDWEGCTTATSELPDPNQRRDVKTSGFPPSLYTRVRFLALEGEGITRMG